MKIYPAALAIILGFGSWVSAQTAPTASSPKPAVLIPITAKGEGVEILMSAAMQFALDNAYAEAKKKAQVLADAKGMLVGFIQYVGRPSFRLERGAPNKASVAIKATVHLKPKT